MAIAGFYKRILPCPPAVEFASREGKELFREALHNGTMEGFFKIISYFQTQSEPAFCGLASLSIVLNALSIDPGRKWKGPWRWFDETMLDCCEPLEKVKVDGITFGKLVCLANCAGAGVETFRANQTSLQKFRSSLARCASSEDCHIIVSYHRSPFKQTGTGHFSPIGGYHAGKDMVLILDVARFKYPPHWVPLPLLWEAMNTKDEMTQQYRGYMLVTRRGLGPSLMYTLSCKQESWKRTSQYLVEQVPQLFEKDSIDTIDKVLSTIMSSLPADPSEFIKLIAEIKGAENSKGEVPIADVQRRAIKKEILQQIRGTQIYSHVSSYLSTTQCCCGSTCINGDPVANVDQTCPESRDLLSVLILSLPPETWEKLQSEDLKREVYNLVCLDNLQCALKEEVLHIRRQLTYLYLCLTGKLDKEFQDPSIDLDAN